MAPPRPHPLAVAPAALAADRAIAAMWKRGITRKPPLDPDHLWEIGARGFDAADESGGRSPEDVADFRLRLSRLCASLREEAELNALGHTMAYGQLTGAIRKRHALGRLWRHRPEILETPIAPPIVVAGQMRSGTTRIHRLLAADPAHTGTRFCNSFDPVPGRPDFRPAKAAFALAVARRINPWLDTLHPFGATRSDEEIGWLSAALNPCAFEAQWHIPSYVAFSEARDSAPIYNEFARILRTDCVAMGNASRPRVLKCPQFAEDLPALLAALPSARVVITKRETEAVLDSTVSMVASQSAFQSDIRDLDAILTEWRRKLTLRERRTAEGLHAHDGPVATIQYAAINADWRAAIASAYSDLGIELNGQAIAAMEREQAAAEKSPHHHHAGTLHQFARART